MAEFNVALLSKGEETVQVFQHEAVYVLHHRCLIPDGYVVIHKDGVTTHDSPENLELSKDGEIVQDTRPVSHKVFHIGSVDDLFLKTHFMDIYRAVFPERVEEPLEQPLEEPESNPEEHTEK